MKKLTMIISSILAGAGAAGYTYHLILPHIAQMFSHSLALGI